MTFDDIWQQELKQMAKDAINRPTFDLDELRLLLNIAWTSGQINGVDAVIDQVKKTMRTH